MVQEALIAPGVVACILEQLRIKARPSASTREREAGNIVVGMTPFEGAADDSIVEGKNLSETIDNARDVLV